MQAIGPRRAHTRPRSGRGWGLAGSMFSWPGRHGFGHIQEWVSRCGHTVHRAPVHDLVRSRPGQLAHGQVYYGLFSGPVPITANVDY